MTPDQREALRAICKLWAGHRIYLVGATSLVVLGKLAQDRVTLDLDLAVDVLLDELRRTMTTAADWKPDPTQEQRWLHRGQTPVDLLAIGAAHLNGGELVWPDTGARMNLVGFDLLSANSRAMTEPGFDDVYVPSPAVVAVLKVAAWLDRPDERRRDLQDLAHLFDRYVEPMDDRMFVGETARRGIFGEDASIFWLGYDIGALAKAAAADLVGGFLSRLRDHGPSLVALVQRWPGVEDEDEALRRLRLLESGLAAGNTAAG